MNAKKSSKKVKKEKDSLKVNEELDGFQLQINSFGEISSTYEIDKLNEFLNKNLDDKKINKEKKKNS